MPLNALAHGQAAHLEIMIGSNRDEDAFMLESGNTALIDLCLCVGARHTWKPHPESFGTWIMDDDREEVIRRMMWEVAGMPKVLQSSAGEIRALIEHLVEAYEEERSLDPFGIGPTGNAAHAAQWLMDTMSSDFAFHAATVLISERLARPGGCKKNLQVSI